MDAEVDRFRVLSVCQQFCFGFISIHRHVTAETVFEKPRNFFVLAAYVELATFRDPTRDVVMYYLSTYLRYDVLLSLATVAVRAPCRLSVPMPSSQVSTRAPLIWGVWGVSLCSYTTSSPSSSRCTGDDLANSNIHVTKFPNLSRRLELKYCLLSIGKHPTSHNFN